MSEIRLNEIKLKVESEKTTVDSSINWVYKHDHQPATPKLKIQRDFQLNIKDLVIPDGQTTVILGPSGCGKSTLLRVVAGLLKQDSGTVHYDNDDVAKIKTGDRGIGMVFQDYALYPQSDARNNIRSFFRLNRKADKRDLNKIERRTAELMEIDLSFFNNRKPGSLSGGEKQRVGIARCITRQPKLFLMDEPFSNLDRKLREKYRANLKKLLREFSITSVYVTHDQQEAQVLADRLVIMKDGKIEQIGAPQEIYQYPANTFVAEFFNIYSDGPAMNWVENPEAATENNGVRLGVRPEHISINNHSQNWARVLRNLSLPFESRLHLHADFQGQELFIRCHPTEETIREGDQIRIDFKKALQFDANTGLLVN